MLSKLLCLFHAVACQCRVRCNSCWRAYGRTVFASLWIYYPIGSVLKECISICSCIQRSTICRQRSWLDIWALRRHIRRAGWEQTKVLTPCLTTYIASKTMSALFVVVEFGGLHSKFWSCETGDVWIMFLPRSSRKPAVFRRVKVLEAKKKRGN